MIIILNTYVVRFSLIFIFLVATYAGFSQTEWESLNGPFGGSVDILIQTENLTLFAGTKHGLFRRTIDNAEWSFVSDLGDAEIIAMISGKDQEIYLSNGSDHFVYRSLDDGETWSKLPMDGEVAYDHIALSSSGALILAEGNSIWISRDKGQTAEKVMLPGDIRIMNLAAGNDGWVAAGTNRGLYASGTDGEEWTEFKKGLPSGLFISHVAIDQEGRAVFSTTENRIFVLGPLDSAFQEFSNGLEEVEVSCLAVDTATGIIIGSFDGTAQVLDTTTGTWAMLPTSQENADAKMLTILPGRQGKIYFARSSKGVHIFDQNCNCTQTINDGLTASEIHSMLISEDLKLIVSTRNELFMHTAADNSWKEIKVGTQSIGVRCLMQASDGKIYAGGSEGVLEIRLDSDHAIVDSIGPFGYSISFLAEDNQGRLVAGSLTQGLFRRETENKGWTDVRTTEMLEAVLTDIHIVEDSTIYVSFHQGIFKSEDGGDSWSIAIDGIPQVGSIITDSDGNVFGSSFPGVVKSTDGGDQWEHVPVGENDPVTSMLSVDMSALFAGSREGIFRSEDVGESWEVFTQGLGVKSTGSLMQDSEGNIYAGTLGGGVYLLKAGVSAISSLDALSLVLQIVPNPTTGSVFLLPNQQLTGEVHVRVYAPDLRTIFEDDHHFENHGRIELNLTNLAKGFYFISVTSAEGTAIEPLIKM